MPRLFVEKGHDKGKVFYVPARGTVLVGREPTVALRTGEAVDTRTQSLERSGPITAPPQGTGRRQSDYVRISDVMASRVHFRIEGKEGGHELYDEKSLNGTFVNGLKVGESRLQIGDAIRIGETLFSFLSDDVVADPMVGHKLAGYLIIERLGRGGMGTVYKAEQIDLQRIVALKVIASEYAKNPSFLELFLHEARAAARLNHHNIVQIYDVKRQDTTYFFSMEYLHGGSVQDQLSKTRILPVSEAVSAILDAAHGLEYAHGKGIIHRDIKPDNLMISETHSIKIGDMGLARSLDDKKKGADPAGMVLGTPHYIAPELLYGKGASFASDIYSLGATLYRLVTGTTPYAATTVNELIRKKINEDPPLPESVNPEVPRDLSGIIQKMMARKPELRYQTMREVIDDLERIKAGMSGSAGGPAVSSGKKWWIAISSAAALIVVGVLTYLALTVWKAPAKPANGSRSPKPPTPVGDAETQKREREKKAGDAFQEASKFENSSMDKSSTASMGEAIHRYKKITGDFPGTGGADLAGKRITFLEKCSEAQNRLSAVDAQDDQAFQKFYVLFQSNRSAELIDVENKTAKVNEMIDPIINAYSGIAQQYRSTPAGEEARKRSEHIQLWKKNLIMEKKRYQEALARSGDAVKTQKYQEAWEGLRRYEEESRARALKTSFSAKRYTDLLYDDLIPKHKDDVRSQADQAFNILKSEADAKAREKKYAEATGKYDFVIGTIRVPELVQRAQDEKRKIEIERDVYLAGVKAEEERKKKELLKADQAEFDRVAQEAFTWIHQLNFKEGRSVLERGKLKFQTEEVRQLMNKRLEQIGQAAYVKEAVIKRITQAIKNNSPERRIRLKNGSMVPLAEIDDEGYRYVDSSGQVGILWNGMRLDDFFEFMRSWTPEPDRRNLVVMCMEIGLYEQAGELLKQLRRGPSRSPQAFLAEYEAYLNQNTYPESPEVEARKRWDRLNRFAMGKPMDTDKVRKELEIYKGKYANTLFYQKQRESLEKLEQKLAQRK